MTSRSSRGWVGGSEGHVPIEEARTRALTRLARAEQAARERQRDLADRAAEFALAMQRKQAAQASLSTAESELEKARQHLAYVASGSDDAQRPEELRGPENDHRAPLAEA